MAASGGLDGVREQEAEGGERQREWVPRNDSHGREVYPRRAPGVERAGSHDIVQPVAGDAGAAGLAAKRVSERSLDSAGRPRSL